MTFRMLHYTASQKLTNIYETLTATIIRVIRKPRAKNQMRYRNTPNKNEVWMDKWTTALLGEENRWNYGNRRKVQYQAVEEIFS